MGIEGKMVNISIGDISLPKNVLLFALSLSINLLHRCLFQLKHFMQSIFYFHIQKFKFRKRSCFCQRSGMCVEYGEQGRVSWRTDLRDLNLVQTS